MNTCISCGMPLDEQHGFGTETVDGRVCQHCLGDDGRPKACAVVFDSGVQFFMSIEGVDKPLAERLTRKNMNALPYWHGKAEACLQGDQATEEEFQQVLSRL